MFVRFMLLLVVLVFVGCGSKSNPLQNLAKPLTEKEPSSSSLQHLEPVLNITTCQSVSGTTEKFTVVITDVLLSGFRGFMNSDGSYADIMVTTLGIEREKDNYYYSGKFQVHTNYNMNNRTDRTYMSDELGKGVIKLTVKLPGQLEKNENTYSATLMMPEEVSVDLIKEVSVDLICKNKFNL